MESSKKKAASVPKYAEVYQKLKADILSGKYPLNSLLPTENELTEMLSVSKITVRHAIQMLKEDNLISVRQGRGAEVILPHRGVEYSSVRYRNAESINVRYHADELGEFAVSEPYVDIIEASLTLSNELDVPVGTEIIRIQKTHGIGKTVIGYVTHYMRKETAPEFCGDQMSFSGSLYSYMKETHGKEFIEGEELIGIVCAGFAESKVLNVPVGKALFLLKRRAYSETGILEYCESLFNPDYFEMEVTLKGED